MLVVEQTFLFSRSSAPDIADCARPPLPVCTHPEKRLRDMHASTHLHTIVGTWPICAPVFAQPRTVAHRSPSAVCTTQFSVRGVGALSDLHCATPPLSACVRIDDFSGATTKGRRQQCEANSYKAASYHNDHTISRTVFENFTNYQL